MSTTSKLVILNRVVRGEGSTGERRPPTTRTRIGGSYSRQGSVRTICLLALLTAIGFSSTTTADETTVVVNQRTESVIRGALRFLQNNQNRNGAWYGLTDRERQFPVAMTAYTLMAYQSAGHVPGEGPFGETVEKGAKFLVGSTSDEGLIGERNSGQYMYFHGIATIALAELYGQTSDDKLRPALERLIKVIIASQNDQGGWRYRPVVRDADISVTVLQVVALRAAKNSGLNVPQRTIDEAVKYVRSCHHDGSGGFSYQPGQGPGFARTAAAIYSLQVCGQYDDPMVLAGSRYLEENYEPGEKWFTYGNFYAAPAQYMIGGKTWENWYGRLQKTLLDSVKKQGDYCHWDTDLDRGEPVGPIYSTAVYAMILAMPYQYIPLYQR